MWDLIIENKLFHHLWEMNSIIIEMNIESRSVLRFLLWSKSLNLGCHNMIDEILWIESELQHHQFEHIEIIHTLNNHQPKFHILDPMVDLLKHFILKDWQLRGMLIFKIKLIFVFYHHIIELDSLQSLQYHQKFFIFSESCLLQFVR
jgi:hypothetical protein